MKVLRPGHCYSLRNLKSDTRTILSFYRDPEIHEQGWNGPSTQEVLRACIDRVRYLDREMPWSGNADIIKHLQAAIAGFEARAIIRKTEKGILDIETIPVMSDGHIPVG